MKEDKFIKINLYIFFIFSVVWLILFFFSGMRFNFSELFYSRLKCFVIQNITQKLLNHLKQNFKHKSYHTNDQN